MEGLLPMMYKAIKTKRNRSRYEFLSSGYAAAADDEPYWPALKNSGDFPVTRSQSCNINPGHHHRRHQSMGDYAFGHTTIKNDDRDFNRNHDMIDDHERKKKDFQLTRFRSHRSFTNRMFSCVGA